MYVSPRDLSYAVVDASHRGRAVARVVSALLYGLWRAHGIARGAAVYRLRGRY